MWFYGLAGSFLIPYVSSPRVANLIGFLLVVFAVLICGGLLGWIVSRFLRTIGLSFFDRLLGAAFGFARGVLIAIALLTAFMAFGPQSRIRRPIVVISREYVGGKLAVCALCARRIAHVRRDRADGAQVKLPQAVRAG